MIKLFNHQKTNPMKKLLLFCLALPSLAFGQLSHQEKKEKHNSVMKMLSKMQSQKRPHTKSNSIYLDSLRYNELDENGNIDYSDLDFFIYDKTLNKPIYREYGGDYSTTGLTIQYDSMGRETMAIEKYTIKNPLSTRVDTSFKTYNQDGHLAEENSYSYYDNNTLSAHERIVYTYENGLLISDSTYFYEPGSQAIHFWSTHEYQNEKLIRSYHFNDDHTGAQYKTEFTYHSNGYISQEVDYVFENGVWVPDYGYTVAYDAQNRMSSFSNYTTESNGSYELWEKVEFKYDSEDKLETYIGYEPENGQLKEIYRGLVTNSSAAPYSDLVLFSDWIYFPEESMPNQIHRLVFQEPIGIEWQTTASYDYYWSGTTTGISDQSKDSEFQLFPNPAQDQLNIESSIDIEKISIYSLQGTLVKQLSISQQQTTSIAIKDLTQGSYILNLEGGNQQLKKIFIKE